MDKKEALKRLSSLENEAQELRKILEEPKCIMERVKTVDDAIEILGDSHKLVKELRIKSNYSFSKREIAISELQIVIEVLNEGWTPDWNNTNEKKWYPYWDMRGNLQFHCSDYCFSDSCVPAHLCFKNEALCNHATKYFYDTYKAYMC